ncbi:protein FAM83D [Lepisosteus oculatus]|uniref:protein FAM83D n=1 Tax=Lepisosteus oculatus TaxID=7918 RepID=UPI0035F514A4
MPDKKKSHDLRKLVTRDTVLSVGFRVSMALSQCLDDFPIPGPTRCRNNLSPQELYSEAHRLALEELISGGKESYVEFLKKEKIPNFLSSDEIRLIMDSAVHPKNVSLSGEDAGMEQSVSSSMDCSSVTYFPEVSDVEPPLLEIGWPAFTAGSFRGVTRAVAHFQPSYGECIYSCKEAARRMIRSAKEVIALVTDSFTDVDIFRDIQEACIKRQVPVYILLDQSCVFSFLQMCKNLDVQLEDLQHMRVRTITGATFYMRSGAKIVGKVHERFMLIDGNRVATGSYRFDWTDGKLNSSNLIELSGQISESFDEEFRVLYAESKPISPKLAPSRRSSGIYDHVLLKVPPAQEPPRTSQFSSTPSKAPVVSVLPGDDEDDAGELSPQGSRVSEMSTIGDDWMEENHMEDVIAAANALTGVDVAVPSSAKVAAAGEPCVPVTCHASTQTFIPVVESSMQTDLANQEEAPTFSACATQTDSKGSFSSGSGSQPSAPPREQPKGYRRSPVKHSPPSPDGSLRDCFNKLTKERQYHYSTIRSKLDHMVALLSQRRELVDLTNLALNPGAYKLRKTQEQCGRHQLVLRETVRLGPLSRSRCLK